MAEDFEGLAKALVIPQSVINNLDKIDKKINQIASDSEKMATHFTSAMTRMGSGTDNLLSRLEKIQSLVGNIGTINVGDLNNVSNSFNKTASEAEKAAENITKVATSVNKVGGADFSSSINNMLAELSKLNEDIRLYKSSIGTGKKTYIDFGQQGLKEASSRAEELMRSISALEEAQKRLRGSKNIFSDYIDGLNGASLASKRQADEIKKLNQYYLELEKSSARQAAQAEKDAEKEARATEKRIKAAQIAHEKQVKEAERQAKAQAKLDSKLRRANYVSYVTSVEGSLRTAGKANTYEQRAQAIKNLEAAMKRLNTTDREYQNNLNRLSEAHKKLVAEQSKVNAYMGKMQQAQHNLMNTSDQLARKLALIFSVSQITQYMKNIVRVTGEFELQNTALASILQNKEKADALFAQVQQLAVKSPFTLKELVTYTKSLSAYQVEYEKLYDTTKMLADVSAGLGVDMQRLILAFGQVKAANFLRGTETRQFTEAGFNILGELAKYYSELEGRVVSLGEVQDRQFKKMIAFKDVEEVFKRATSEGGLFYQMQERQAETIAGQISNLKDTIDIMLNDIGSSNRGTIMFVVSSIKAVIANWDVLANILKGATAAFVVYSATVAKASISNGTFAASSSGVVGALAKMTAGVKSFSAALAKNPYTIAIGAIVAIGATVYDQFTKLEKTRKEYDTLVKTVNTSKKEFEDSANKLEQQNQKLQEAEAKLSSYSVGTKEYYAAEKEANKIREAHRNLVEQIAQEYPELNEQLKKAKDGTVDVAAAQKTYNEYLERTNYLLYLAKEGETLFSDGIIENASDLNESLNAYRSEERNLTNAWNDITVAIGETLATSNRIPEATRKSVETIVNSTKPIEQKIVELRGIANFASLFRDAYSIATRTLVDLRSTQRDVRSDQKSLEQNIIDMAAKYKAVYNTSTEEGKKATAESIKNFMDALNIQDSAIRKFVQQQFQIRIGVELDWGQADIPKVLSGLEKKVSDYIKTNKLTLLPRIQEGQGIEAYFKNLKGKLSEITEEIGKLNRATEQREDNVTNKQRIASLKAEQKQVIQLLSAYGEYEPIKKRSSTANDAERKALDLLKERIKLIQDARNEYKNLLKYYTQEEATTNVQRVFKDAFSAAGMSIEMDFDISSVIDAINKIPNAVKAKGERVKREAVYKLGSERDVEIRATGLDEIKRQVDDIFSSYEFNLEFATKGLDKGAFKELLKSVGATDLEIQGLGLDIDTFEKAQKKIREIIADLTAKGGQNNLDAAKAFQEKLTQLEVTEAKKRLDELFTLREKYQSKEEKIQEVEVDVAAWEQDLAEIEKLGDKANKTQAELLRHRIQNGKDTILQLKSEALQLTEFWQTLFGDLGDLSVNSLRGLSKTVEDIVGSAKEVKGSKGETVGYTASYKDRNGIQKEVTLTVQQYQRLLKQNNQVANEIEKKNPFVALFDAIVKGKNAGETSLDYITRLEGMLTGVTDAAFDVANNLADIFGASDDAKEFLANIQGIATGAVSLGTGIAKIAEGDVLGGAMSAISGIAKVAKSIFSIGDAKQEKEIEKQTRLVEDLERAYQRLYDTIENGLSMDTYAQSSALIENMKQQIESYRRMIEAEKDKKNTDWDSIRSWENSIENLYDRIDELYQNIKTTLIGDFKTAAQSLGDAIVEAFENGTNAAEAWGDSVKEIVAEIVKSILIQKLIEPRVQEIMNEMFEQSMPKTNEAQKQFEKVKDIRDQITELENSNLSFFAKRKQLNKLKDELAKAEKEYYRLNEAAAGEVPNITEGIVDNTIGALEDLGEQVVDNPAWDMIKDLLGGEGSDSLSGLSKSIQGVTEDTAQALEALLSSIRFFTSDSNAVLHNIYNAIISPSVENPFLAELKVQSSYLSSINSLLSSVSKNVQSNGKAIKVQIV